MASPFNFSHPPISSSVLRTSSGIVPSGRGPMFSSKLLFLLTMSTNWCKMKSADLNSSCSRYPPGKIADRGVGLPMLRLNVLAQAAFKIASAGMPVEIVILDVDHARNSVRRAKVVMERRKSRNVAPIVRLARPPVEVHHLGMIFLHNLGHARQPIIGVLRANVCPVVQNHLLGIGKPGVRRAIERSVLGIVYIGAQGAATVEKPVVFGAAIYEVPKCRPSARTGLRQVTNHIPLRPHFRR